MTVKNERTMVFNWSFLMGWYFKAHSFYMVHAILTAAVFSGHIILPLQECHFSDIVQYVGFLLWLLLFSIIHWRFIYNVASSRCSFWLLSSIPLCRNTKISFIHSPVERYLFFFYKCDLQISSPFSFSWHCLLKSKCFWFW